MLRAHNGTCNYYSWPGCFYSIRNLLQQFVFGYVKSALLCFEGAFREFPGDVDRCAKRVLEAFSKACGGNADDVAFDNFEHNVFAPL